MIYKNVFNFLFWSDLSALSFKSRESDLFINKFHYRIQCHKSKQLLPNKSNNS